MAHIPKIKRTNKHQARVDRPVVITGNFDLNYEDVIKRNRLAIVAFMVTGMLAVAAFIPAAVYRSTANNERVIVDVENGQIANPLQVTIVKGDSQAGGSGYIEFGPKK